MPFTCLSHTHTQTHMCNIYKTQLVYIFGKNFERYFWYDKHKKNHFKETSRKFFCGDFMNNLKLNVKCCAYQHKVPILMGYAMKMFFFLFIFSILEKSNPKKICKAEQSIENIEEKNHEATTYIFFGNQE